MEGSLQEPSVVPETLGFQHAEATAESHEENLGSLEDHNQDHDHDHENDDDAIVAPVAPPSSSKPVLSDELRDKIIKQVEYYFSDENLPSDKYLMKYMNKDKEGFVPIAAVASFRKMKKLVQDNAMVATALRESSQLVVSSNGKKVKRLYPLPDMDPVKRLYPLPDIDPGDVKSRTVLVENLPEDHSTESLEKIFGNVGMVKNISIRNPHSIAHESTKTGKPEKAISSKLHALIEYTTVESAEKAVSTLNDERSWRSGMHVEILIKRMKKYGLGLRGWKPSMHENNNVSEFDVGDDQNARVSEPHDEKTAAEGEEHPTTEREVRKGRRRGRGRGHGQHNANGHGHGSMPSGPVSECSSKPPPGPRMPDGTRGFTMGRGRPPISGADLHVQ